MLHMCTVSLIYLCKQCDVSGGRGTTRAHTISIDFLAGYTWDKVSTYIYKRHIAGLNNSRDVYRSLIIVTLLSSIVCVCVSSINRHVFTPIVSSRSHCVGLVGF